MKIYSNLSRVFIVLFLASFAFTSCAKKIMFEPSKVVPGAEGKVKIKKDGNNNYSISIDVLHLAEAKRLQPARSAYLVWMETEQNSVKNLGILNSSSGLFSKTLKASLNTVSPFKPTKIYITAEDDLTSTYPSGETVLTTGAL